MQAAAMVWLAILIGFVVLEAATAALVSVWFCLGALAALGAALLWPEAVVVQIMVFLVVSAVALLALRPVVRRMTAGKRVPTNADANIGKLCQVVAEIQPARVGRVKLEGLEWAAKSNATLQVGQWCRVTGIEGVKVLVVPAQAEEPPAQAGCPAG